MHIKRLILALTLLLTSLGVARAQADGDPATQSVPRLIPYEGYLELNGAPYNGNVEMVFTLYDAAEAELWTEEYSEGSGSAPVAVYASRFSVLLGQHVDIEGTILDADALYLGIAVRSIGDASYTPLSGRSLITPAPFSLWSSSAADFTVAGDATVNGGLIVDADDSLTDTAVIRAGQLTVDSQDSQGLVNLVAGAEPSVTASSAHAYLGTRGASRVYLNDGSISFHVGAASNAGQAAGDTVAWLTGLEIDSSANVSVSNNLSVSGSLNVGASGEIAENLDISSPTTTGGALDVGGSVNIDDNATIKGNVDISSPSHTGATVDIGGSLHVDSDLIVWGTIRANSVDFAEAICPNNPTGTLSSNKSTMCIYLWDTGDGSIWNEAADYCWVTHGAKLCSYNDLRIARSQGAINSIETRRWLRDRVSNDNALYTDINNASNFEAATNVENIQSGAYCCLMLRDL